MIWMIKIKHARTGRGIILGGNRFNEVKISNVVVGDGLVLATIHEFDIKGEPQYYWELSSDVWSSIKSDLFVDLTDIERTINEWNLIEVI